MAKLHRGWGFVLRPPESGESGCRATCSSHSDLLHVPQPPGAGSQRPAALLRGPGWDHTLRPGPWAPLLPHPHPPGAPSTLAPSEPSALHCLFTPSSSPSPLTLPSSHWSLPNPSCHPDVLFLSPYPSTPPPRLFAQTTPSAQTLTLAHSLKPCSGCHLFQEALLPSGWAKGPLLMPHPHHLCYL